jgi:hypothetical protein
MKKKKRSELYNAINALIVEANPEMKEKSKLKIVYKLK